MFKTVTAALCILASRATATSTVRECMKQKLQSCVNELNTLPADPWDRDEWINAVQNHDFDEDCAAKNLGCCDDAAAASDPLCAEDVSSVVTCLHLSREGGIIPGLLDKEGCNCKSFLTFVEDTILPTSDDPSAAQQFEFLSSCCTENTDVQTFNKCMSKWQKESGGSGSGSGSGTGTGNEGDTWNSAPGAPSDEDKDASLSTEEVKGKDDTSGAFSKLTLTASFGFGVMSVLAITLI